MTDMLVLKGIATDQVADDDSSLSVVPVLKSDDDHSVGSETAAPAIMPILFADLGSCHELQVAVRADVIVAAVAL